MSSPEGKVQTPEGRIILSQDLPQYEQSVQKKRAETTKKEQAEYDAAVKEYEKDVKAAEAQYQKDLAAYEKQQAEAAKAQNKYDAEIKRLEAQKQKELADAHYSVWGPGGSRNRSELTQKQQTIQKNYNSAINKQVEQKRIQTGYQEFSIAYPGQVIPANVAKTFRSSPSFSLVGLYEKKIEGKAAKAEYQRQASAQTAQAIGAKSSAEYHGNIPNIGFISSGLGTERGSAVKPLPDAPTGKKAVETRQRLTNVNTGQSIMGGQQATPEITITRTETYRETPGGPVLVRNVERTIPEKKASKGVPSFANPVAFVASLDRQNVDAAGKQKTIQGKEGTQNVFTFQNISNVQDPSAIALLEFQQQLKTRTAPSAGVYKGILAEQGLPETPLSKRIIKEYSAKPVKKFKTRAEAFGLPEAKGKLFTVTDPKTGGSFSFETGLGGTSKEDVKIATALGVQVKDVDIISKFQQSFKSTSPIPGALLSSIVKESGAVSTPEGKAILSDLIRYEKPVKDDPFLPISSRSFSRTAKYTNPVTGESFDAKTLAGSPVIATQLGYVYEKETVPDQKQTLLNKDIEMRYNKSGELQEILQKRVKEGDLSDVIVQIAYAPSEAVRSVIGAGGSIVNLFEQNIDPLTEKTLGLKTTVAPAPIIFQSDVAGTVAIPYQFENKRFDLSFEEYAQRQSQFIEKKGVPAYVTGVGFDYIGLKGVPSLVKTGIKSAPKLLSVIAKPALPRLGRGAFATVFHSPGLEQFGKSKGVLSKPGEKWDVAEPVQKVGLRIERKVQPTWTVQKQQLPVPNYGKERIMPYYLRQGISKVADFGKRVLEKPRGLTTPIWLKNFSDISLNPAHLGTKPNIPTRVQLEKPPEYKRTYPTLGIMRNIFYPDIPAPRSKAPLIPAGFTKINPRTITAKKSARQIIKLPSLFKSKISIPKLSSPQFIKRSQQQWQGFVFMQKKRIGEFKETLPTFPSLPKPKANQFVTIQRKIRDVKSGILETKRLGLQLFEWPTAKKQIVPAYSKRELINLTREDIGIPSNIKIVPRKEPRKLSFGIAPSKSPPFMEGFMEMPFRARRGKAPIEISRFSDVSGLGSITQRPQSFFEMRRRFPKQSVEFPSIPKGTGIDVLKGEPIQWPENWMLKQRKANTQDYLYKLEKIGDKKEWMEYPKPKGQFSSTTIKMQGYSQIIPKKTQSRIESAFIFRQAEKGLEKWTLEQKENKRIIDRMLGEEAAKKARLIKSGRYTEATYPETKSVKPEYSEFLRTALPSTKQTRITSERFRQLPKLDPSWPKPPSPVQGDEFMNQLTALRRKSKGETNMLFSDPRRTSKVNVRLIKNEMEGMGYFKTATPFQLKQPKLADWPANWKELAKAESPDVADYLSQKRSFRKFGKTEKESMLKGVSGAGASSYPDVPFGRFGKQKGVPTNLFTLEKATPPVSFPVKRETGMFRMLERSAAEQEKLDKMWGHQMGRVLKERKKGDLPSITTRIDDTAETIRGKAKLSFVSEPLRTSPIVFQRQRGLFDTRLSIRKGRLVRGLKPVRDVRDYLPDKFAETRKAPKGGKPLDLSSWKPKLGIPEPKESSFFFKREKFGKNVIREDMALPSIRPALIIDKQTFKKITIQYRKGKTDVFFRKFEKSPINSPTKDLSKRTNWDKLASESKKERERKDKAWEESQRAPKGGQILVPPEPNPLNLATPEVPIPEAFADVGAKVPFKKDKYKIPLIIPPTPKETKKERQTAQVYQEIILSDNRPKLSTVQSPRISLAVSQPQKIQESFKINSIQTPRIKIAEMTVTKPRQRERQRPKTIQTPKYETISLTRITPKLRAAQTPKLASPLAPKAPTKLKAPQRQPLREKPIQILRTRPPPKTPRAIFAWPPQKEPEKKKPRKEEKQVSGIYLGNVPLEQISGIFGKRKEITLGKEKIAKTLRGDVRVLAGKPRNVKRSKKQEDMFGFKNESKKRKTKFF